MDRRTRFRDQGPACDDTVALRGRELGVPARSMTDSGIVAFWVLVSRLTGFGRVAVMGAVLGPTYFGNIFQTTVLVPIMLFGLLGGSLVGAVLVPLLVRWVDERDAAATRSLANGFLGVLLLVLAAVAALMALAAPALLTLATSAVGDPEVRQHQREVGSLLLYLLLPQMLLYGVVAVGTAVQHAHGRFAVAAAAPVLENLGSIAVMGVSALMFGFGTDVARIPTSHLLLLGLGTTASVGLHAALQWWGAFRSGVTLAPSAGWRHPEIQQLVRIAFTSSGYAVLYNLTLFGCLIVAGSVPGGVIAFQIGQNFLALPVALGAMPLALVQLPQMSRSFNRGDGAEFLTVYRTSIRLSFFITLPAGFLFMALAEPLAHAVAFGEMAGVAGLTMITACIASVGPGVVGDAATSFSTSAAYARRDALTPFRAMAIRAVIASAAMVLALVAMEGVALLWALGLGLSTANLAAAAYQYFALTRSMPPIDGGGSPLLGDFAASAAAAAIAWLVALGLQSGIGGGHAGSIGIALAAVAGGGAAYLAIQAALRSPELHMLLSAVRSRHRCAGETTPLPSKGDI